MSWTDPIFRYCERGQDPGLFAEPFNALSNAGFLLAALAAWRLSRRPACLAPVQASPVTDRGRDPAVAILIALAALIGVGSFLFHTFATRWSRLADVIPIGLFMACYLVLALRRFLGWSWRSVSLGVAIFSIATLAASAIACPASLRSVTAYAREPCLKGTIGYVPAFAALLVIGAVARGNASVGRLLLVAAGMLLVAMTMRWIDRDACPLTVLLGRTRGTHALWHLVNSGVLYILLLAMIRHGDVRGGSAARSAGMASKGGP